MFVTRNNADDWTIVLQDDFIDRKRLWLLKLAALFRSLDPRRLVWRWSVVAANSPSGDRKCKKQNRARDQFQPPLRHNPFRRRRWRSHRSGGRTVHHPDKEIKQKDGEAEDASPQRE